MKIADQISTKLSKIGNADYSFHGVYGIWMGSQGRNSKSSPANTPRSNNASPKLTRQSSSPQKRTEDSSAPAEMTNVSDTANNLPMVETAKSAQRNLALMACGFAFDLKGFERELIE
jgi:hypothetical protein